MLSEIYPWIKALHILALISWMAALLYLPRLFVYHLERGQEPGELRDTLKIMERKLQNGIMNPAMIATWIFGIILMLTPGIIDFNYDIWFHIKLLSVIFLTMFHIWLMKIRYILEQDRFILSGRKMRFLNEVPALIMILIVVMVIVRPISS